MLSDAKLETFPKTDTEALAFLYVKSQDLSGKTPAEIHTMYLDAIYEIRRDRREKVKSGYFKKKSAEEQQ